MPLSNLTVELPCGNEKQAANSFDRALEAQISGIPEPECVGFARRGSLLLPGSFCSVRRSITLEETG
jgi:hypothetical protein